MSKGWVYVYSNPSIPDKVKVGWTKRMPEERGAEERGAFIPDDHILETAFLFQSKAPDVEQKAHELLTDVHYNKEWFICDPYCARDKILEAAKLIGEEVFGEHPVLPPKVDIEEDSGEDFKRAPDDQKTVQISCDCGRTFPAPAHPFYPSRSLCPNCHSDWTVFADPENPGEFVIQSHSSVAAQEEEAKRQLQEEEEHRKRKSSYKKKSAFGEHPVLPPKEPDMPTTDGWVYVLSNPSIPSWVKVGWTKGGPEDRSKELQSTGVPTPFKVETAFLFSNRADVVEGRAHELLSEKRVSSAREFFDCTPHFAAEKILEAAELLGEPVRGTDPILTPKADIEEEHQRREAEARREYDRAMNPVPRLGDRRFIKDGEIHVHIPPRPNWGVRGSGSSRQSFEEWNSPGERAKRERGKRVTEILNKNLEERQAAEDPFLTKKGCMPIFLGILGLITTVPLLLSKITWF